MSGSVENSGEHLAEDSSLDFPEPPEKPLDSDCCGTGCVPCVFDIYDEEMAKWRLECDRIKSGKSILEDLPNGSFEQALSTSEFRCFELESITRMTDDSCIYRFKIPGNRKLGIKVGQHLIMRWDVNMTEIIPLVYLLEMFWLSWEMVGFNLMSTVANWITLSLPRSHLQFTLLSAIQFL